jgi:hypothetical protein
LRIEGDGPTEWHECLVIDISVLGVGIELHGVVLTDAVGQEIAIEVQTPVGTSVNIRLYGQVRYTLPEPRGGQRVGVEFIGLSETERSILDVLEMMQAGW